MSAAADPLPKIAPDGRINVLSPLDGRLLERIPATDPAEVPALVERARAAQRSWAAIPISERARILRGAVRALAEAAEELVEALRVELGRHPAESWFAEIVPNLDLIRWWTGPGRRHLRTERVRLNPISYPRKRAAVHLVPRGVLGLITPWNYPVAIPLRSLVPALLAGNAVVWKPSEYAAGVSRRLHELLGRVLPADLVILAQGDGRVGAAVVDAVDGIGFTGSLAVGRRIAVRAAERLIPFSVELGGKDLAVVLPDADLERTAAGIAWAAFTNAGQNCAAVELVAVHESIAPKFMELFRNEVARIAPFVGPVINATQKEKIVAQLEEAISRGGVVVEGGLGEPEGLRIEPTVIEHVDLSARICREETFGPVAPVFTFREFAEIERLLAEADYGLTLSLWTRDYAWARRIAPKLPVGVVTVDNHSFTAAIPTLPWTGVKGSGLGVTNGPYALEWMVRPQGYLEDHSGMRELWWHPYNEAAIRLARGMANLTAGVGSRLAALRDVLVGMLGRWRS